MTLFLADFSESGFTTIKGFPHPTQRSVMPVVTIRGDEVRAVGTCFAISNHGLVLTARHVIDDALGLQDGRGEPNSTCWVYAVYAAEPDADDGENPPEAVGSPIPANKIHFLPGLDIAVMHLNLPIRSTTNKPIRMPAHRISPAIPAVGTNCFALGYHKMHWNIADDGKHTHQVSQSYSASRGTVEEIHYPIRDRNTLPFPCFRVSSHYDGGMSGGPVLNERGSVIGVVCSELSADEQGHISYASLAGLSLLLQVDASEQLRGPVEPKFLWDFAIGGAGSLDLTDGYFHADRQADTISLDFGMSPTFSNKIGA